MEILSGKSFWNCLIPANKVRPKCNGHEIGWFYLAVSIDPTTNVDHQRLQQRSQNGRVWILSDSTLSCYVPEPFYFNWSNDHSLRTQITEIFKNSKIGDRLPQHSS